MRQANAIIFLYIFLSCMKAGSGAVINDGKAFTGSTSDSEIKSWVDSLNIK